MHPKKKPLVLVKCDAFANKLYILISREDPGSGKAISLDRLRKPGAEPAGNFAIAGMEYSIGDFSISLSQFCPSIRYYFRAKAVDNLGRVAFGSQQAFIAFPAPAEVEAWAATDIAEHSATLNGNLVSLGATDINLVNINFQYIRDDDHLPYQESTAIYVSMPGPFSIAISGLAKGKTYSYHAVVIGDGGSRSCSQEMTFVTQNQVGITIKPVDQLDLLLSWLQERTAWLRNILAGF